MRGRRGPRPVGHGRRGRGARRRRRRRDDRHREPGRLPGRDVRERDAHRSRLAHDVGPARRRRGSTSARGPWPCGVRRTACTSRSSAPWTWASRRSSDGIELVAVSVGNPHAVVTGDPSRIAELGPRLETRSAVPGADERPGRAHGTVRRGRPLASGSVGWGRRRRPARVPSRWRLRRTATGRSSCTSRAATSASAWPTDARGSPGRQNGSPDRRRAFLTAGFVEDTDSPPVASSYVAS